MKLSDVKFEDVKIGQRVIGANGMPGQVLKKLREGEPCSWIPQHTCRYDTIEIVWDHREQNSLVFHFWCEHITVVE